MAHDILLTGGASTFDIALTPPPATIIPTMMPPVHRVSTVTLDQAAGGFTLLPGGIPTLQRGGLPTLMLQLVPSGIPSPARSGAVTVTSMYTIIPQALPSLARSGDVTLTSNINLSLAGIPVRLPAYTLALLPGGVTIQLSAMVLEKPLGPPQLNLTIFPAGSPSRSIAGLISLMHWIMPGAIPSLARAGAISLSSLYTVALNGIPTGMQVPPIILAATYTLTPTAIPTFSRPGLHSLIPGAVTVILNGVPTASRAGAVVVTVTGLTMYPNGIPTGLGLGSPILVPGAVSLTLPGIPGLRSLGSPSISILVSPAAIASMGRPGSITILPGAISVQPPGVASLARTGSLTIVAGAVILNVASAQGARALGVPALHYRIFAGGLPSSSQLGLPILQIAGAVLVPAGIPSMMNGGSVDVYETGIPFLILLAIWLREGGTVIRYEDQYFQVVRNPNLRFVLLPQGNYLELADHTRRWDGWWGPKP